MEPEAEISPEENISFQEEEKKPGHAGMEAWKKWKTNPSPVAMGNAIKAVQPMIERAVTRFPQYNHNVLSGEARRLTIQALKTYDPSQGAALGTHIFNHLLPLGRRGQAMTRIVSVARSRQDEVGRLVKANRDFQEQHNREPSDGELMDLLQVSPKKLHSLRQGTAFEMPEGGMESLPDMGEDPRLAMWTDYVYHDMAPLGQKIMDYKLGRNGHPVLPTEEIAAKLNVHPTYITRIAKDAAEKILKGVNSMKKE